MIFNINELININFEEVLETSIETVRKSVDNTKVFVKWEGSIPLSVQSLTTKEGPYSSEEMRIILEGKDWFKTINFLS